VRQQTVSARGKVQKSPFSKAAALLTRGAYGLYVSTAKGRERRWRLFSTFPQRMTKRSPNIYPHNFLKSQEKNQIQPAPGFSSDSQSKIKECGKGFRKGFQPSRNPFESWQGVLPGVGRWDDLLTQPTPFLQTWPWFRH